MTPAIRKRAVSLLSAAAIGLAATLTTVWTPRATTVTAAARESAAAVSDGAAGRLAGALRFATVSSEDPSAFDPAPFQALHDYLRSSFPLVHARLRREAVAVHSLLYTWPGADPTLKPILLAGHLDVVPIESGMEPQWSEPAFSGRMSGGYIWGRGAIDNKASVIGILEAVEMLLEENFQPARTVYLAFGHDEEVGGASGARLIAARLAERGVQLEMVLDEGGVIGEGILPGVPAPVALVGIAEKGFVSVELSTKGAGGHSSVPPVESTIGILARALTRLEDQPVPARLEGATRQMFDTLRPQLSLTRRILLANLWLTRPMIVRRLTASPGTNAMIRTTTAPTIVQAGAKDNVLPTSARAVVNFRILPGDSVSSTVDHVRRVVNDQRIDVRPAGRFVAEPSGVSSTSTGMFATLETAVHSHVPDAVVAPYLVVAVTDSRYYASHSRTVFRFQPIRLTAQDLQRTHGLNERIAISNYHDAIRMYRDVIRAAAR